MSLNKVMLIGNLGSDPEVRYTQGGAAVANFNIATNEKWTNKQGEPQERTEWHKIVVWGRVAENCGKYLSKGRSVYVEGSIQTREWDDKDGNKRYTTEVNARTVQFLSGGTSAGGAGMGNQAPQRGPSNPPQNNNNNNNSGGGGGQSSSKFDQSFSDDDIPF